MEQTDARRAQDSGTKSDSMPRSGACRDSAGANRDYGIDLLKILACCAVVGLHTFQKNLSPLNSTLYYACGFAIPVFWMSSGAFLMNRGPVGWGYALRKAGSVLRVVVLWNFALVAVELAADVLFGSECTVGPMTFLWECAACLVQEGTLWHFWYFGALVVMYLALPLLTRLGACGRLGLLIVSGGGCLVLQLCSILAGSPIQANVVQTFRLWTWVFYFMAGGMLYSKVKGRTAWQTCRWCVNLAFAGICIAVIVYQSILGRYVITGAASVLNAEYFYDSASMMLWAGALFVWCSTMDIGTKAQAWVARIAPLTMGIYIVHPMIMKVMGHFVAINTPLAAIGSFFVVLSCAAMAAAAIKRVPVLRCLTKI